MKFSTPLIFLAGLASTAQSFDVKGQGAGASALSILSGSQASQFIRGGRRAGECVNLGGGITWISFDPKNDRDCCISVYKDNRCRQLAFKSCIFLPGLYYAPGFRSVSTQGC